MLGSAITVLDVEEDGKKKRLVFTGDLGRATCPILRDPEVPDGRRRAHHREHLRRSPARAASRRWTTSSPTSSTRVYERGGKVIIPSFALERAQEIIYALKKLERQGRIPPMPVYVDSPLTVKITDVFKLHPECYDAETRALLRERRLAVRLRPSFATSPSVEDCKAHRRRRASPAIIISASGMCEAGRILHHLKATIEDPKNTVLIVGFQAQHTLGRRLVERRRA